MDPPSEDDSVAFSIISNDEYFGRNFRGSGHTALGSRGYDRERTHCQAEKTPQGDCRTPAGILRRRMGRLPQAQDRSLDQRSLPCPRRNRLHRKAPPRLGKGQARQMELAVSLEQEHEPLRAQGPRAHHVAVELPLPAIRLAHRRGRCRRQRRNRKTQSQDAARHRVP